MRKICSLLMLLILLSTSNLQGVMINTAIAAAGDISTLAGTGVAGFSGDGGPATSAELDFPQGVAADSAGNIYIGDAQNNRIRIVDSSGDINTFATGINVPRGIHYDEASGNLYVSSFNDRRIFEVDSGGTVTTVAGSGNNCTPSTDPCGDGGSATSADLGGPHDVAVDSLGNIYFVTVSSDKVRRIDGATGIITTVAGDGVDAFTADGNLAQGNSINNPFGIAIDEDDNLYIAEYGSNRVRRIDATTGILSTYAGSGSGTYSGDGGPATSAGMQPIDLFFDSLGNLFIADRTDRIRRVDADTQIITTVAGDGTACSPPTDPCGDGGPATSAQVDTPHAVTIDSDFNLVIVEQGTDRVRLVEDVSPPMSVISTTPGPQQLNVAQSSTIQLVFDRSLNTGSVSETELPVFGSYTGRIDGVYAFSTTTQSNDTVTFTPDEDFLVGEIIWVTVSESVLSTSSRSVEGGYQYQFQVEAPQGSGNFAPRINYSGDNNNREFKSGDLDRDGDIDLVSPGSLGSDINVYLNDGTGAFPSQDTYAGVLNNAFLELADLDNDGFLDIATTAASGGNTNVHVYLNDGDGTFAPLVAYSIGVNGTNIESCDLNGDGYLDLITSTSNADTVSFLINDTDGTFSGLTGLSSGNSPSFIDCGDVNGDGLNDIINTDSTDQEFSVFINTGGANFASRVQYSTTDTTFHVRLADVDADGDLDALLAKSLSGDDALSVHLNNGDGTFVADGDYLVGDAADHITFADFDSDGDIDVSMGNSNDSTVSVLFNDGAGAYNTSDLYTPAPNFSRYITTADYNLDGAMDMAVGGFSGNQFSIYLNQINTAPTASTPTFVSQATDGSGEVTLQTTVEDSDLDTTRIQIEYSDDAGSNFYDAELISVTPDSGSTDLDNSTSYQVGTNDAVDTDGGSVLMTLVWDTQSASNGNGPVTGEQSDIQFRVTPNDQIEDGSDATSLSFSVDNLAPTGLTALTDGASTQTTQELIWTAVTESNFDHYEIWYGENQSDVVNRTGTATEWDDSDDVNLSSITTDTTTITGLSAGAGYFFKVFALDVFGNEETVPELSLQTVSGSDRRRRIAVEPLEVTITDETPDTTEDDLVDVDSEIPGELRGSAEVERPVSRVLPALESVTSIDQVKALQVLFDWMDPKMSQLTDHNTLLRNHFWQILNLRKTINVLAEGIGFQNGVIYNKPSRTNIENVAEFLKVLVLNFHECFDEELFLRMRSHDTPENSFWWAGYWHVVGDVIPGEYKLWDSVLGMNLFAIIESLVINHCSP